MHNTKNQLLFFIYFFFFFWVPQLLTDTGQEASVQFVQNWYPQFRLLAVTAASVTAHLITQGLCDDMLHRAPLKGDRYGKGWQRKRGDGGCTDGGQSRRGTVQRAEWNDRRLWASCEALPSCMGSSHCLSTIFNLALYLICSLLHLHCLLIQFFVRCVRS